VHLPARSFDLARPGVAPPLEKTEKLKIKKKTGMLGSIGKQSRESVESVLKKKRKVTSLE